MGSLEHPPMSAKKIIGHRAAMELEPDRVVKYITECAVFELRPDGVCLIEVAPGIDVQTQVIDLMGLE